MRRFLRALGRVILLLIALALIGFCIIAFQVDALGRQDDARKSDAIVILGARVNADGQPGSDLTSRTYRAVDLWQAGYAPVLICTGGFKDEPLSAASVCRRFAIELGVPADSILLADGSSNTVEDARVTTEIMADHGWRTALLVSHPLHVYRARWLFRRAGIDAVTSPTSTETARIYLPLRAWYAMREAAAVVITAVDGWGLLPATWIQRVQRWSYQLSALSHERGVPGQS